MLGRLLGVPVPKGAELSRIVRRAFAVEVLIALYERPGLGTYQITRAVDGNDSSTRSVLDFFEKEDIVYKSNVGSPESPRFLYYLATHGETLAREVLGVVQRLYPYETSATAPSEESVERLILTRGVPDVLFALREKSLTLEELPRILRSDNARAHQVWLEIVRLGIASVTALIRSGQPYTALILTEKGRRLVADIEKRGKGKTKEGAQDREFEEAREGLRTMRDFGDQHG